MLRRLLDCIDGPLKWAVVALWLLSAVIVALAAAIGMTEVLVIFPLFLLLAFGTARRWRWALAVDLVLILGSTVGTIGSAVEVARGGVDKAPQLAPLGVDPFYAALLNLTISLAAAVLLGWTLVRYRTLGGRASR